MAKHGGHSSGLSRGMLFMTFRLVESSRVVGSPDPSRGGPLGLLNGASDSVIVVMVVLAFPSRARILWQFIPCLRFFLKLRLARAN